MSKYTIYKKGDLIDSIRIGSKMQCIFNNGNIIDCIYMGFNFNDTIKAIIDKSEKIISLHDIKTIKVIKEENKMSKKEQLLNELEQIKKQQKELTEKLEIIQKKVEQEDNKNGWWIPKEGEGYYYICTDGYVQGALNTGADIDKCKINNINCYETGQQAERVAFEQLLHRKLKKFMVENNSKVDWNNDDNKYDIWYDYEDKQFNTGCYESARDFAQIYFSSEEIAEKAIEEFKDDLVRYFTSDK